MLLEIPLFILVRDVGTAQLKTELFFGSFATHLCAELEMFVTWFKRLSSLLNKINIK